MAGIGVLLQKLQGGPLGPVYQIRLKTINEVEGVISYCDFLLMVLLTFG